MINLRTSSGNIYEVEIIPQLEKGFPLGAPYPELHAEFLHELREYKSGRYGQSEYWCVLNAMTCAPHEGLFTQDQIEKATKLTELWKYCVNRKG